MSYKNETKLCQNCKKDFTIEVEDFNFYEKIKVPPPTFCPECRAIRRFLWRNMRSLYKRECGLCHIKLISLYPDDGCPVFCISCFNGNGWDPYAISSEIDWSQDFISQINVLFKQQPRIYQIRIGNVVNSDYGNSVVDSKNSYMCFSSLDNEDVMYSESIDRSRNTIDCFSVQDLDQCSFNVLSNKNYNSHFLVSSNSCIDSYFLYDCVNCQNCVLSSNLRNQQYVFRNQKLSKEEYLKAVEGLRLNTFTGVEKARIDFEKLFEASIHRYAQIVSSQNATGDYIFNSKNIKKSFDVTDSSENISYSTRILKSKDLFDVTTSLSGELCYDCVGSSGNTFMQISTFYCIGSKNTSYSISCKNCSDCFGCVGLTGARYCILNKQYTKEQYQELIPRIINYMETNPYLDKRGIKYTYGEFFPCDMSPYSYNETAALDYYPLLREDAIARGYGWIKRDRTDLNAMDSLTLPDDINDISEDILDQVISCPNNGREDLRCTSFFKIVNNELAFYKNKKLPVPRYCPNCRHYQRLKYRNPIVLYHRKCMKKGCENEFETSYAPERPEIVYCEKCYQQEVY
jgi:hypothetical protein